MMNTIAIFGAPRSGTSWLGQLFNSSPCVAYRFQPLFSYAFKGQLTDNSSQADIDRFHEQLLNTNDDFILQLKNISGKNGPPFFKNAPTHLVWKEVRYHYVIENLLRQSAIKIIGIVRHPCAVIHSWLKAPREFNPAWDSLSEWKEAAKKNQDKKEEYYGYRKWKELACLYLRLKADYSGRFTIITYEQLNHSTHESVCGLFDFAGLAMTDQTRDFITASKSIHSNDPYDVYRLEQKNDAWREELLPEIQQSIMHDPDYNALQEVYQWQS